jgi:hypothetical protein
MNLSGVPLFVKGNKYQKESATNHHTLPAYVEGIIMSRNQVLRMLHIHTHICRYVATKYQGLPF